MIVSRTQVATLYQSMDRPIPQTEYVRCAACGYVGYTEIPGPCPGCRGHLVWRVVSTSVQSAIGIITKPATPLIED